MSDSLWPHGLYSPWNSPGQNTKVGSLSLLQGIFPTQRANPGLPHCRQILYQLSQKGRPRILEWVDTMAITYLWTSTRKTEKRTLIVIIKHNYFSDYWKHFMLRMIFDECSLEHKHSHTWCPIWEVHAEASYSNFLITKPSIFFFQTLWSYSQTTCHYSWTSNDSHLRPYILPSKLDNEIYSLSFSQLEGIPFVNVFQGNL